MKTTLKIIFAVSPCTLVTPVLLTSCGNKQHTFTFFNGEDWGTNYWYDLVKGKTFENDSEWVNDLTKLCINYGLDHFSTWHNKITKQKFEPDGIKENYIKNLYCSSEQQAIFMYANLGGDFWNLPLHKHEEPIDTKSTKTSEFWGEVDLYIPYGEETQYIDCYTSYDIHGSDYNYITSALDKSTNPFDVVVYHGVESLEVEYWDQLKEYIKHTDKGYDYSDCVGKTFTSYGFLACSANRPYCEKFFEWGPENPNPLKEPVMFIIKVPKDTKGYTYIASWNDLKYWPENSKEAEWMSMLNINTKLQIEAVQKEKGINYFTVKVINE